MTLVRHWTNRTRAVDGTHVYIAIAAREVKTPNPSIFARRRTIIAATYTSGTSLPFTTETTCGRKKDAITVGASYFTAVHIILCSPFPSAIFHQFYYLFSCWQSPTSTPFSGYIIIWISSYLIKIISVWYNIIFSVFRFCYSFIPLSIIISVFFRNIRSNITSGPFSSTW